ncbi:MAG: heme exporter protein CcmD [Actinomycetota bacterium]
MDDLGFIVGSYVVTFGSILAYVVSVVRRSRRAGRDVPREQRPWT